MPQRPLWVHATTFPPEPRSVASARLFVRDRLALHEMSSLNDDITTVASELATNALTHAGTYYTVTLTAFPTTVVLAVSDGSPTPPVLIHAADDDITGRGIAIVDDLTQDWGVTHEGNSGKSVWATFKLP